MTTAWTWISKRGVAARILPALLAIGLATVPALAQGTPAAAAGHTAPAGHDRAAVAAGDISTVAGGTGGSGKGTTVALRDPCGVGYGDGALYIGGDNNSATVEKLNQSTGQLTTAAGDGDSVGGLTDGGLASLASLGYSCSVTADHHGNLVIADPTDGQVLVVAHRSGTFYQQAMTAGHLYEVEAGPGPSAVATDGGGNLVITDTQDSRIWVLAERTGTFYGQAMTAGHVYLVAGTKRGFSGDGGPATAARLNFPDRTTVDSAGNLVIPDSGNGRIRVVAEKSATFYGKKMTAGDIYNVAGDGTAGFSGDGIPAVQSSLSPQQVTADAHGNLVIADGTNRIRVVAGKTGTFYGQAMIAAHIYTVAGDGTAGFSGDGGPATSAELRSQDVAVDGAGNLVIADTGNRRVRVVAASTGMFYGQALTAGNIYTVAGNGAEISGNGGPAVKAFLFDPEGMAVDAAGNVVIADSDSGEIRVLAHSTGTFYGKTMARGDIYDVAGGGTHSPGDGGPATQAALAFPADVAVDGAGNLVIADTQADRVQVVASSSGTFYGKAMTAGHIYSVAGDGRYGYSGDGGPATAAMLHNPDGVVVDQSGNLVISDWANHRVRFVAEKTGTFYGQAMAAGNIYTVAGDGTQGSSGDGGPATAAELGNPVGVTVDSAGNLVISDESGGRVRVVAASSGMFYGQAMTAGYIYTVAGGGFSGDGGPATQAELSEPGGVTMDAAGNLLIADTNDQRIRVVAEQTGTFYGQAMTAGDIYTMAGNGTAGYSGDGGPATSATLSYPSAVAADGAGDVLISDSAAGRIREVQGG